MAGKNRPYRDSLQFPVFLSGQQLIPLQPKFFFVSRFYFQLTIDSPVPVTIDVLSRLISKSIP